MLFRIVLGFLRLLVRVIFRLVIGYLKLLAAVNRLRRTRAICEEEEVNESSSVKQLGVIKLTTIV